jgi:hypothetical protein
MHTYAMRMAAVFTISTATIGLRTGFVPRWLGFSGYAMAVILLLGVDLTLWVEVLFPFWIPSGHWKWASRPGSFRAPAAPEGRRHENMAYASRHLRNQHLGLAA